MGRQFLPVDRDAPALLPVNMLDWVPEDHVVRLVIDTVEAMAACHDRLCTSPARGEPGHDVAACHAAMTGGIGHRRLRRRVLQRGKHQRPRR